MQRIFSGAAIASLALVLTGSANAVQVYGLSTRNQLVSFDSATPNTLGQANFITGLQANEAMIGIDFRPLNNVLYGLGSFGNLYTVNTSNGAASFVAGLTNNVGGGAIGLNGVEFGFDFNPTVDRIRITSNLGQNLRANPLTGVTVVDASLNPTGAHIVGSAYINNDNNSSTGTTLYNIDSNSDMLTIQNPPNNGTQVNVGLLGVNTSALVGFDVLTVGTSNTAYAALQPFGSTGSGFYTVNLASGAASFVGTIGLNQSSDSLAIRDIAVNPVPEPATLAAIGIGAAALIRRRRKA